MATRIPQNQQWKQDNSSDLFGNIYLTKNISFDEMGYLKLAGSPRAYYSEGTDGDFENVAAYVQNGATKLLAVTWGSGWSVDFQPLSVAPTKITTTPNPSGDIQSDAVWFDNKLVVTTQSSAVFLDGSTWTDTNISLSSTNGGQHPMTHFVSQNKLAVANLNTIGLYSTMSATPVLDITLTLPTNFWVTGMTYFNQNLFIATRHRNGEKACVFTWNGSSPEYQNVYELDSHIIHDIETFDNTTYLLQSNGELSYFTGTGFKQADAFPMFHSPYVLTDMLNIGIYKNCLKSNGDVLYISFASSQAPVDGTNPGGVWCFDPKIGLYHKYAFSINEVKRKTIQTTDVSTANNTITWTGHGLITGTEVAYKNPGTVIAPLKKDNVYFVIVVDANTIKLATSKANAVAGTEIGLTSTGFSQQSLIAFPNYDFGASMVYRPFAIKPLFSLNDSLYGTDLVWSTQTPNATDMDSLPGYGGTISEDVSAYGWYVSPKILSPETQDKYNNFVLKHTTLEDEDRIIIKYRTTDGADYGLQSDVGGDGLIYWATKNSFAVKNFTTNLSFDKWADAEVGDEIEILQGSGAGLLAHITNIELSGGDYVVTIDEDHEYFASGQSRGIFRKWTKLVELDNTHTDDFYANQMDAHGKFIQFKVVLIGKGIKIDGMSIDNKTLLPAGR